MQFFNEIKTQGLNDYSHNVCSVSAVIPLTDSQHKLLPVQFSVDPGEDFVWGRDENSPHIIDRLTLGTKELNVLLKDYLNVVNVPISLTPLSGKYKHLKYCHTRDI